MTYINKWKQTSFQINEKSLCNNQIMKEFKFEINNYLPLKYFKSRVEKFKHAIL
jgi:hypothetical protein